MSGSVEEARGCQAQAMPVAVDEQLEALSHVDSDQGDVPQTELHSMRQRIRDGEVDTKWMLQWIEDAKEAALPAQQLLVQEGFVGGKRELQREGQVPFGSVCPALSARVEVEFNDAIYCGTVIRVRSETACTVLFDADGDQIDITCGQHRFQEIQRENAGTSIAALTCANPETGQRYTPRKRKRGSSQSEACEANADAPAVHAENGPDAPQGSLSAAPNAVPSESAAIAEGSALTSSEVFAEEPGDVKLSQTTTELVGGVTNDLNASLAQIGMFLEADCAEKEGKSRA